MSLALLLVLLVAAQRLAETLYAARNTKALLARGAIETGAKHYPLILLLHGGWLAAIFVAVAITPDPVIRPLPLVLFLVLQAARLWVISTLGPFWTTRIITLPGAALVNKGPYRFVRHPNYIVVAGEIAVFPLVFGEIWIAVIFSVLNALVLGIRIRVENDALAARRRS
jgi:methyltransferase